MSEDTIDEGCEREQRDRELCISKARKKAAEMPQGVAGECMVCGEQSKRLVYNACAVCRDKYKLG